MRGDLLFGHMASVGKQRNSAKLPVPTRVSGPQAHSLAGVDRRQGAGGAVNADDDPGKGHPQAAQRYAAQAAAFSQPHPHACDQLRPGESLAVLLMWRLRCHKHGDIIVGTFFCHAAATGCIKSIEVTWQAIHLLNRTSYACMQDGTCTTAGNEAVRTQRARACNKVELRVSCAGGPGLRAGTKFPQEQ